MCDYTLYTHTHIYTYVFTVWTLRLRELWVASQVLNTSEGPWFVSPKTVSLSSPGAGDAAHEGLQRGQDADADHRAVHGRSPALPLAAAGDGHNREMPAAVG